MFQPITPLREPAQEQEPPVMQIIPQFVAVMIVNASEMLVPVLHQLDNNTNETRMKSDPKSK